MSHYYNEFNPEAAAMLRQFMKDGLIPHGDVDERSITEVTPDDVKGYTQCHFFAGIAGWQFALQQAGWEADRPVWTGSCPCQPFSSAGRQKGKEDERHLWPVWERLISECKPPVIFGEQVATAITKGWLDDVYEMLEAKGYAVGSAVLAASAVGAPHKRDRLWFVADTEIQQSSCYDSSISKKKQRESGRSDCSDCVLADSDGKRLEPQGAEQQAAGIGRGCEIGSTGYWSSAVWIECPDGKVRPVEPSIPLLVDGFQHRKPILHAIGNAIVPQVAAEFIGAYMEVADERN